LSAVVVVVVGGGAAAAAAAMGLIEASQMCLCFTSKPIHLIYESGCRELNI
jgi:succinate dehydrogenase/fumarate reductase flavoprotein subunit